MIKNGNAPGAVKAIIVAAGSSSRMQTEGQERIEKPFVMLAGKPMLARTIEAFEQAPSVSGITLVMYRQGIETARAMVEEFGFSKVEGIVAGGETRQASVMNGMLATKDAAFIAVHDGARPLIRPEEIETGIALARSDDKVGVTAMTKVVDTVKEIAYRNVFRGTLDRSALRAVATPQIFSYEMLFKGHLRGADMATDDTMLVEAAGFSVVGYEVSRENIKITTPSDLIFAEAILAARRKGDEAAAVEHYQPRDLALTYESTSIVE